MAFPEGLSEPRRQTAHFVLGTGSAPLSTCVLIWEALVTGTAGAGVRDRGQVVEQAHQSGTDSGVVCAAIPAPCICGQFETDTAYATPQAKLWHGRCV